MLLEREKAVLGGGKGDLMAQGRIVRLGAVVPNPSAVFSRGRLFWSTGSALVVREGQVLDVEGVLVCCWREAADWGAFSSIFIWCFVVCEAPFESRWP